MGADLYIEKIFRENNDKYKDDFDRAVKARDTATTDEVKDEFQKAVTAAYDKMYSVGYFRDPYNNNDLLWQFELSWWSDITKKYCKSGSMSYTKAKLLLDELKNREELFEKNLQDLLEGKNRVWDYDTDWKTKEKTYKKDENLTQKDREEYVTYYRKEYEKLKAFLQTAIDLKTAIDCSL